MSKANIKLYNKVIRRIAEEHTEHLGVDTLRSRVAMAHWCRRLRKEFPFSKQSFYHPAVEAPRKPVQGFQAQARG